MNIKTTQLQRQESDRQGAKRWYSPLLARPEVGPIGVLLLLFCMLGYFSIPEGQFSLNPFSGKILSMDFIRYSKFIKFKISDDV